MSSMQFIFSYRLFNEVQKNSKKTQIIYVNFEMRMVKSQKTNGKISIDFVKILIDFGKNFNIDMLKLNKTLYFL